MRIHLDQIPSEGLALKGEESCKVLAIDDHQTWFEQPLHYALFALIVSSGLLVKGRLWTEVNLTCARCLTKFARPLAVDEFFFQEELSQRRRFDLTGNLREDILLQLPQRALCKPTCKGLCLVCGQNLNVKPCGCKESFESGRGTMSRMLENLNQRRFHGSS